MNLELMELCVVTTIPDLVDWLVTGIGSMIIILYVSLFVLQYFLPWAEDVFGQIVHSWIEWFEKV